MMQLTAEQIAHVCHNANRALQMEQGDESIPVAPAWKDLSDEMRESIVNGVQNILSGRITSPADSHAEWVKFKEERGWTRGPIKDENKKEHPLLVPYRFLPEDARLKDEMFFAIVNALKPKQTKAQAFHEGAAGH